MSYGEPQTSIYFLNSLPISKSSAPHEVQHKFLWFQLGFMHGSPLLKEKSMKWIAKHFRFIKTCPSWIAIKNDPNNFLVIEEIMEYMSSLINNWDTTRLTLEFELYGR